MSSGATIQKITAKLIKAPSRVVAVGIRILRRRTEIPLTTGASLRYKRFFPLKDSLHQELRFLTISKNICNSLSLSITLPLFFPSHLFILSLSLSLSLSLLLSFGRLLFFPSILVLLLITVVYYHYISRFFSGHSSRTFLNERNC